MNYYLMEPPIEKPFREMSKKEAREYFDWYISQIPSRIELLKNSCLYTEGINESVLNLSPESLIPLWDWSLRHITTIKKSQEEIMEERSKLPDHLKVFQNANKLSLGSIAISMDVAIYFSEVLIVKNPNIKWDILTKPRNDADFNQPVLIGFINKVTLNPRIVVYNLANKVAKGEADPEGLFKLYKIWLELSQEG